MGTLVAAQDRQIFYMTADPMVPTAVSECLRREGLPPAQVVDLGLLRELGAAVRLSEQLAVPERRRIPSPEGMTAEAYGVAVMATPFDPRSLFEEQHLYHAASGDLPLLYRLLVYGISTAGEWLSCVESRNDSRILPHEKQRRYLGAALDVTSAYLSAWLPGRGKRVSAEIIDRSPLAPSAREKVRDISLEFNGHPGKLLAHLTQKGDDRLKNLKKLGECVEYLKEICDCHEDEKLPQEAIVRQVFVSMAPNIAAGDITADEVGRLVHELWHKSPVD